MTKSLAAVLLALALAGAIAGIVLIRRAVKRYGSEALRKGSSLNPRGTAQTIAIWDRR